MHSQRLLLALSPMFSTGGPGMVPGRRRAVRKTVIVLLGVGILLDLLVSVVLVNNYRQIQKVTSEAHIAKVASYEACLASNRSKAADSERWDKVLALVDTMPDNPQVETFVAGVRAANRTADHPADCTDLVP
jgi:hypothetical protein